MESQPESQPQNPEFENNSKNLSSFQIKLGTQWLRDSFGINRSKVQTSPQALSMDLNHLCLVLVVTWETVLQ